MCIRDSTHTHACLTFTCMHENHMYQHRITRMKMALLFPGPEGKGAGVLFLLTRESWTAQWRLPNQWKLHPQRICPVTLTAAVRTRRRWSHAMGVFACFDWRCQFTISSGGCLLWACYDRVMLSGVKNTKTVSRTWLFFSFWNNKQKQSRSWECWCVRFELSFLE